MRESESESERESVWVWPESRVEMNALEYNIPNSMLNDFETVAKYGIWMLADNRRRLMDDRRFSFKRIN